MAKRSSLPADARGALSSASALIILAELIGDPSFGYLVGFVSFALICFAMVRIPLRSSMLGLMFFAIVLPNPAEGTPTTWQPPFSVLGAALLNHLNTIDRGGPLSSIPVSGAEIFMAWLYLVHRYRKSTRSRIDAGTLPVPRPLMQLAYVSLGTTAFAWLHGLASGGNFGMSLWQVNAVLYTPLLFMLFSISLRGPDDHADLARVFLGAAIYKSLLAVYVMSTKVIVVSPTESVPPAYATAHADSMLFALAIVIVLAGAIERADKRWIRLVLVVLPVLLAGTHANNRRLAWVEITLVLLVLYFVSRETTLKRRIRRTVYVIVPIAALYVAAGWNSQGGGFFKPAQMVRSVVDAKSDGSSMWRELENYNVLATFWQHMVLGTGYGHEYLEIVYMPMVDYVLERYLPHNSYLGLWAYTGTVGVFGLSALWMGGLYFAMRAYHRTQDPKIATAAVVSFGAVPIYLVQCYGDLGLTSWTGTFMMGASLAVSGKLATYTQQWHGGTLTKRAGGRAHAGTGGAHG